MDLKRLAVRLSLGQQLYGSEAFGRGLSLGQSCMDLKRLAVCRRTAAVWI